MVTLTMKQKFIPKVGKEVEMWCRMAHKKGLPHLPEMLHRRGVNMRYLGLLLDALTDPVCRFLVLVEGAARVIKVRPSDYVIVYFECIFFWFITIFCLLFCWIE